MEPTILIVHEGGYFLPSAWTSFISVLKSAGFDALWLPTCGDTRPPVSILTNDVKAVRDVAAQLVQGGNSYGGIPTSEAIVPPSTAQTAPVQGIIYLIYLTCWLIPKSQAVQTVISKYGFLSDVDVGMNDDGTAFAKNAQDVFLQRRVAPVAG